MITDKKRGEITRNTSYILLFVDSAIMAKSLSNPVINLSEGIFRVKCSKMQNLQN